LCPIAEKAFFDNIVNLPIHPRLTEKQMDYVIASVKTSVAEIKAGSGKK